MPKKPPGTEPLILGKKWANEQFVTITTAEEADAIRELQKPYEHEFAVPITVYFSHRRIIDPLVQAMMLAYTKIRKATMEAFDTIFEKF